MSILFTRARINNLEMQNRFVRSATFEGMGTANWGPAESLGVLYGNLADGGVGLIVTGGAFVERYKKFPQFKSGAPHPVAIDNDSLIDEWRRITEGVHKHGSRIVMQITHLGRQDNPVLRGTDPIAPSLVPDRISGFAPRPMTVKEIQDMVERFAQACRRTREAGFDGVQLHGGHGFLISNFLSPYTNVRTDQYGGATENRSRFVVEIVKRARELTGDDYPLMIKMNCDDFVPGGLVVDEAVRIAGIIVEAGIDCIEVTGGIRESAGYIRRLDALATRNVNREAYFQTLSVALKKGVDVPIILVGGMRTPSVMENVVREKIADFVALARPFICEPDLIRKLKAGDWSTSKCASCNTCLKNAFVHPLRCYEAGRPKKQSAKEG
ncbi:NADH:flavin oxidoreductase [Candidatus Poribacteria bacterium]|nr:NADH:flavin oxidoreductase [Candidatus Poribacteria bacterium]